MIEEWELWACAVQALKQHGEGTSDFIAARIAALSDIGDTDGVATWEAIADRLAALVAANDRSPPSRARH